MQQRSKPSASQTDKRPNTVKAPRANLPIVALTLNEACKSTGVGRNTMLDLIHEGQLTARMVGKKFIIHIDDLNDAVKNLPTVKPARAAMSDRQLEIPFEAPEENTPLNKGEFN